MNVKHIFKEKRYELAEEIIYELRKITSCLVEDMNIHLENCKMLIRAYLIDIL